jgi:hypothetical protein
MSASEYARKFIPFLVVSFPLALRGENPGPVGPMALTLDATEINRQLLHAQLSLPVNPGPLTLAYPKWIPGEHAPTGPIDSLVDLKLSANGQPLAWHRDLVELYLIHCDIPSGVSRIDISLDYVVPTETEGYSGSRSSTALLGLINWNQVVLYPIGLNTDNLTVEAKLRLPLCRLLSVPRPFVFSQCRSPRLSIPRSSPVNIIGTFSWQNPRLPTRWTLSQTALPR